MIQMVCVTNFERIMMNTYIFDTLSVLKAANHVVTVEVTGSSFTGLVIQLSREGVVLEQDTSNWARGHGTKKVAHVPLDKILLVRVQVPVQIE